VLENGQPARTIAVDDEATTNENSATTINVVANDSDPDGEAFDLIGPLNGTTNEGGTFSRVGTTSFTYTPPAGFVGTDTFTYTITDGVATVTVVVNDVNEDPTAVDDSATTQENVPVNISVLANDSDPDGDTPTLDFSSVNNGDNGTAIPNADGTITYSPNFGFVGTDTFTYTIEDGRGGTDVATVTVTVTPGQTGNQAPIAVDDFANTPENVPVAINLLGDDSDPDGDDIDFAGDTSGTTAQGGTFSQTGVVSFTYTPPTNFVGTDTFTYTITDGELTDTATVTVVVNNVNQDPIAGDDSATTEFQTPVTINVLDNDSDPDGDPLTVAPDTTSPSNGSVVVNGDGTITYTPNDGFSGTDTFTYFVNDGNEASDSATVSVVVNDEVIVDAPNVTSTVINGGNIQRSEIQAVEFTFDQDVEFADFAAAVSVTGPEGEVDIPNGNFEYDSESKTLTVTLTGLINVNGDYSISLDSSQIYEAGNPSNTLEETSSVDFHRLLGDYDGDRAVSLADRTLMLTQLRSVLTGGPFDSSLDIDGDGQVSIVDYFAWTLTFGDTLDSEDIN